MEIPMALSNLFKSAKTVAAEKVAADREWFIKTIIRVVEHLTANQPQQGDGGAYHWKFEQQALRSVYIDLGLAVPGNNGYQFWFRLGDPCPQCLNEDDWRKL